MTQRSCRSIARAVWTTLLAVLVLTSMPVDSSLSKDGPPAPLPQPTEAQLGVPTYPGAKFDGQTSAGRSMNESYYWIFTTTDAIEKVAAFYKGKTGLTPKDLSGSYLFALKKGESELFPDHGVMIEPNKILPPTRRRPPS